MTDTELHDSFAMAALIGLLHTVNSAFALNKHDQVAKMAYNLADAMMEERAERSAKKPRYRHDR